MEEQRFFFYKCRNLGVVMPIVEVLLFGEDSPATIIGAVVNPGDEPLRGGYGLGLRVKKHDNYPARLGVVDGGDLILPDLGGSVGRAEGAQYSRGDDCAEDESRDELFHGRSPFYRSSRTMGWFLFRTIFVGH